MKNHFKYISIAALISLTTAGCKKDFFNRPPESSVTVGNYYQTAAQVQGSTTALYSTPWFGWNGKVSWAVTELASGNGRTGSSDVINFGNFSVSNTNFELGSAWNSFFTVIAQANGILDNLPTTVPASVDKAVVNNALGEAHLMRGLAYFYLVRVFGAVPIVEHPLNYVDNYQLYTNPVPDVYKFIVNDLKFAEANCSGPTTKVKGHASSGSASALLAKVYLYMQDYTNARTEAEKVINSGEFGLFGIDVGGVTFNDLFRIANNNNKESIIALQWIANGGYGFGNSVQASFAYSSAITQTGDGYGVLAPSFDLIDAFAASVGDTVRRKATIMLPGDHYPELTQSQGGYTLPANANSQGTHAQIKKYVTGTPADNNGQSAAQSTSMNTYIMRYSDVLLIEAEAILGQGAGSSATGLSFTASTTDATALKYFNLVRQRAGINLLNRITFQDIIKERRLEFAIEGDYWFDLCRLDGYNVTAHPKAIAIISAQDRGTSDNSTPPVRYGNGYYTPNNSSFLFPYPATEVAADPNLAKPSVPYVFK